MSQRPWVGLKSIHVSDYKNNRLRVEVAYTNTGHSPAEPLWFRAFAFTPLDSPQQQQAKDWCEGQPTYSGVGVFLMPGQEGQTQWWSDQLQPDTIKYIRERLSSVPEAQRTAGLHPEGIIMIGCIDCRWNRRCYRTRFSTQYNANPKPPSESIWDYVSLQLHQRRR